MKSNIVKARTGYETLIHVVDACRWFNAGPVFYDVGEYQTRIGSMYDVPNYSGPMSAGWLYRPNNISSSLKFICCLKH